jgi:pimeloyl-ACP methyl ester carboxylesterase
MRFVALVILLSITSPLAVAKDAGEALEYWSGAMDAGTRLFRFRIETATDANGSTTQQLVSLDEGNRVFPLDDFQLNTTNLAFALKSTKAKYVGVISHNGKTSTGQWEQAGQTFDLVFHKVASVPIDLPAEIWSGTLNTLIQKLELRVRVYHRDNGTEDVYFDSVSQKASGFKATRMVDDDQWTLEVASLRGAFDGKLNDDKSEVTGSWTQSGLNFDLTLTRQESLVEDVVPIPNRPQTPKTPFPYRVKEITFQNETDGLQLAGTLTIPESDHPCPAVVLISGSGPQDRDETLLDHKPFWVIADYLSRRGIAVLRFDDRGTGASKGDFSTATSEDFANDVEAAFEFLRIQPEISARKTGLIGHSEGGLIAPIVATRRTDVAFVVLLAGPGVNGREILLTQGQLILRAEGVTDESLLNIQRNTQLAMIDTILEAAPDSTRETLVDSAMARLSKTLPEESMTEDNLKATAAAGIDQLNSPWFRFFLTYEPASQLQRIKCPVLAINGEKDVQVDPRLNLPAIQAALENGGNTRFKAIEFPGLNHLFQTCTTGRPSAYQSIEETIAPIVLQTIAEWITGVSLSDLIE